MPPPGTEWLQTAACDHMTHAPDYIRTIERRIGRKIGLPEETVWCRALTTADEVRARAVDSVKSGYGSHLLEQGR